MPIKLSAGLAPAEATTYRLQAPPLRRFRRARPGGTTTGQLPSRLKCQSSSPPGSPRRKQRLTGYNAAQADKVSAGLAPAGPQLDSYKQTQMPIKLSAGLAPAEATTCRLQRRTPLPHKFPPGSPRRDHNWTATSRLKANKLSAGLAPAEATTYRLQPPHCLSSAEASPAETTSRALLPPGRARRRATIFRVSPVAAQLSSRRGEPGGNVGDCCLARTGSVADQLRPAGQARAVAEDVALPAL